MGVGYTTADMLSDMRLATFLLLLVWPALAQFRAAAVKMDITPDGPQPLLGYQARQSTGVLDRLWHRIVAFDDGRTQFYLVATDIALVSPSVYDEVCRELKQETGIEPRQLWWTTTHTHAAPEVGPPGVAKLFLGERYQHEPDARYAARVKRELIDGVKQARARLEPARLTWGKGYAAANINRRARDADGKIRLGLNPDGPVDREIGLIRVDNAAGKPIALVANYAMHGTAMSGANTLISGDAPGVVASYVEEKLGAPMLFVNGAAGNIAPIYSGYADSRAAHLGEFRVLLGDRILQASAKLPPAQASATMQLEEEWVEIPRKAGLGWAEDLGAYLKNDALIRLPVRYWRLGKDTVAWAAPVELFCEIALDIRARSGLKHTWFFGYANGWMGYLPTKAAYAEGGYEPSVAPFSDEGEALLTRAVLAHLRKR